MNNTGLIKLPAPIYTKVKLIPDDLDYELERINQLSIEEFEDYAEKLRLYLLYLYEVKHFPIGANGKTLQTVVTDLRKFNEYDTKSILMEDVDGNKDILCCFNKWQSAINLWFPEMFDTVISTVNISVIDQLRSKERFHKNLNGLVVKDQFKFRSKDPLGKLSSYISSGLRIINGSQPVANFPSGIAKWIYLHTLSKNQFKNKESLNILDQSMGWAGRFTGLISACNTSLLKDKHINLIGTDPNSQTHDRFNMILDFWKEYYNPEIKLNLYKSLLPSEDLLKDDYINNHLGEIDMSLTSPPYFNREQYSKDEDQSYMRYNTYQKWRDGFLSGTLENTYKLLRNKGYCYWNIADIKISSSKDINKSHLPLEQDSINIAKKLGFKHVFTYKMLMASMVGTSRVDGNKVLGKNLVTVADKTYKFEPIFVFKKE